MQLLKSGDSTIMAAIAKSNEDLLSKFKAAMMKVSSDILDTQDRLAEINKAIETQKPIYSLTANVFVRRKHGSVKIIARYNNIEALKKFLEMMSGAKAESPAVDAPGIACGGSRMSRFTSVRETK